jgi:phenylacetyl-CoA:acceptor oxidoreductase subunit 1
MERIDKGVEPGIDREVTPACINTCPVKARHFGDLDESENHMSNLIREQKGSLLHPEWNTEPSVCYLVE